MKQLILGGARSGKSQLAEQRARDGGKSLIYLATAEAGDEEMRRRIAQHQEQRNSQWHTVEEPLRLAQALRQGASAEHCVVVDCLTLWLSNCLHQDCWQQEKSALLHLLPQLPGDIILVSNEVGSGVVPLGQLSREFVDHSGTLHQQLAQLCDTVTLVVAGLPLELKSTTP